MLRPSASSILALAIAATALASAARAAVPGDVDANGLVEPLDLATLHRHLVDPVAAPLTPEGEAAADVAPFPGGDTVLDAEDLAVLYVALSELDFDGDTVTILDEGPAGASPLSADSDADGMSDLWEIAEGTKAGVFDAGADPDLDGVVNIIEYLGGTQPLSTDSDGDGILDYSDSALIWPTCDQVGPGIGDPTFDADGDGLTNAQESLIRSNPCSPDTDGDGVPDDQDNCSYSTAFTDPDQTDTDGDGWGDVCDPCPAVSDPTLAVDDLGEPVACLCGDVNDDGARDDGDLALYDTYASDPAAGLPSYARCDVDGDGICVATTDGDALADYLAGAGPPPVRTCNDVVRLEQHVVDRLGYGWSPATRDHLASLRATHGTADHAYLREYISEQLVPHTDPADEGMPDPSRIENRFTVATDREILENWVGMYQPEISNIGAAHQENEQMEWKILKATYSAHQLQSVLEDFWFNHFNVNGGGEVRQRAGIPTYVRKAIRPNMYGKFEDLVLAMAQHPAMLEYLNLFQNKKDDENENFAREVMELHTIGVDGGYGEEEVQALTTLLTGWRFTHTVNVWYDRNDNGTADADEYYCREGDKDGSPLTPEWVQDLIAGGEDLILCEDYPDIYFIAPASQHDSSSVTLDIQYTRAEDPFDTSLPNVTAGAGEYVVAIPSPTDLADGENFLRLLSRLPATAYRISRKLAVRFVADDPSDALVAAMAAEWLATEGDLTAVMQVMFDSDEFLGFRHIRTKVKRPHVLQASLLRALGDGAEGYDVDLVMNAPGPVPTKRLNSNVARNALIEMGEHVYHVHPPTGASESSADWGSAVGPHVFGQNMIRTFSKSSVYATVPGYDWHAIPSSTPAEVDAMPEALVEMLVPGGVSRSTLSVLEDYADALHTQVGLSGIALNKEVAALLLSSPEFLVH